MNSPPRLPRVIRTFSSKYKKSKYPPDRLKNGNEIFGTRLYLKNASVISQLIRRRTMDPSIPLSKLAAIGLYYHDTIILLHYLFPKSKKKG